MCEFCEYPITICPPGKAFGCFDLNNRGFDFVLEITCWPKQKHGKFTTGESTMFTFLPEPITLNDQEKQICAILGLEERDYYTFIRRWSIWSDDKREKPTTVKDAQKLLYSYGKVAKR